jgi:adenylosuccinate lyase
MSERGLVPSDAARELRAKATFDIGRIEEIEQTTQHDVIAFTTAVAEKRRPGAPLAALRPDLSDVVDTAQALQMREACDVILQGRRRLDGGGALRAEEHRRTPMIGRTHGVHAEPMTFGLKLRALVRGAAARSRPRAAARDSRLGRQALGRGRDVCASRSVDRSERVRAPRLQAAPVSRRSSSAIAMRS